MAGNLTTPRGSSMPTAPVSPENQAEIDDLEQAIKEAVEAEIGELAANLATTDDAHLFGDNEFKPPQQNLWVRFGSGSCPRLCKRASFATFAVRKPYDFLVTNFTLLFRPSTAPDEIAPRARNQFKISG